MTALKSSTQNMFLLLLPIVGMGIGFFTIMGLTSSSRQDDGGGGDDRSIVVVPTPSPTAVSPSPGDLFVETSAPTRGTATTTTTTPTRAPAVPAPSTPTASAAPSTTMPTTSAPITDTDAPTAAKTAAPTIKPTLSPTTSEPTQSPTTVQPTVSPTGVPSIEATTPLLNEENDDPTPTAVPTDKPTTLTPTTSPTTPEPTPTPTHSPTTMEPTASPTNSPTNSPTQSPTTRSPTVSPTNTPTTTEPTASPTNTPTTVMDEPTSSPSTREPTAVPTTTSPTQVPTESPTTLEPTLSPTTREPTLRPTTESTASPTSRPTRTPTAEPTERPTPRPTESPVDNGGNDPEIVYGIQPGCYDQDDTRFNMCLDLSSPSGQVEDWFAMVVSAARRWERVISADPFGPWPAGFYTTINDKYIATERPTSSIDDMYVGVIVTSLDGSGGRFAEAGPDRTQNGGVISSSILIDKVDLQNVINNGIFEGLMLHEMFHCLGLGTMWTEGVHYQGTEYIGTKGVEEWNNMGCTGPMPMANDQAHWDDDCFNTEVGTHFLRFGHPVHISSVSMGALEDLGYEVDRNEADAFGLGDLGSCGNSCPAANGIRRSMLRATRHNSTSTPIQVPKLSAAAEQSLFQAAAQRFRERSHARQDRYLDDKNLVDGSSVSYIYEENGQYISRVVHRHEVEHMI